MVKILADAEQSDVLKEAKFLHRLNHINVVDFVAICPLKKAIMLEYMAFDMKEFGGNSGRFQR